VVCGSLVSTIVTDTLDELLIPLRVFVISYLSWNHR
jgi:hypothetical protein